MSWFDRLEMQRYLKPLVQRVSLPLRTPLGTTNGLSLSLSLVPHTQGFNQLSDIALLKASDIEDLVRDGALFGDFHASLCRVCVRWC